MRMSRRVAVTSPPASVVRKLTRQEQIRLTPFTSYLLPLGNSGSFFEFVQQELTTTVGSQGEPLFFNYDRDILLDSIPSPKYDAIFGLKYGTRLRGYKRGQEKRPYSHHRCGRISPHRSRYVSGDSVSRSDDDRIGAAGNCPFRGFDAGIVARNPLLFKTWHR